MRDEKGSLDVTTVGVLALTVEHLLVQLDVVVVDGIVERHHDHLGHLFGFEFARDFGTGLRAETIGQQADGRIARWSAIGIRVQVCRYPIINNVIKRIFSIKNCSLSTARVFVRSVGTVWHSVTEKAAFDTSTVVASQHSFLAEGLVRRQDRLDTALLLLDETVFHLFFPVTSLLLDIESETSWASDSLQSL